CSCSARPSSSPWDVGIAAPPQPATSAAASPPPCSHSSSARSPTPCCPPNGHSPTACPYTCPTSLPSPPHTRCGATPAGPMPSPTTGACHCPHRRSSPPSSSHRQHLVSG